MSTDDSGGPAKPQKSLIQASLQQYPFFEADPKNGNSIFCIICNLSFKAMKTKKIERHLNSKNHLKHSNDNESKESRSRKFLVKWLEDVRFESWLQVVPNNEHQFRCTLCSFDGSCRGGISNILRHAEKADHVQKCKAVDLETLDDFSAEHIHESATSYHAEVKQREIEFVRLGVSTNTPFRTLPKFLHFFQQTKPATLQNMTTGATKASAMVINVLASDEESRLVEILRKTKFSVHVDETTDPNGSVKWMTFLVKYVDPETLDTAEGLPKLIKLDSTKLNAEGVFGAFKRYMTEQKIPFSNIVAVSFDNASVMVGKNKSFKTFMQCENPSILFIPCICHKLALIAKDACEKIPPYIEKILHAIAHHMKSTKRSEAFAQITRALQNTEEVILNYAKTRWLGRLICIKRVLKLYSSLLHYFTEFCCSEKNETFTDIKKQSDDPRTQAYLQFLGFVLHFFKNINLLFQRKDTQVHELHSRCLQFSKNIAKHFLKEALLPYFIEARIDFRLSSNQKCLSEVDFGHECNDIINNLSRDMESNKVIIIEIRENCLAFYVEAVEKSIERLYYIRDQFFVDLSVFRAEQALSLEESRDFTFRKVWNVAEKFADYDKAALKSEWRLLPPEFSSQPGIPLDMLSFDEMWKTILSRRNSDGNARFPLLTSLVGCIRSLPHSNASAERTFSLLPDICTKKRNRLSNESVSALTVVKSATKLEGRSARTFDEDQLSLMSASNLYQMPKKKVKLLTLYPDSE